jgi:hypothetical protein
MYRSRFFLVLTAVALAPFAAEAQQASAFAADAAASVSILQSAMSERIAVGHNKLGALVPIGHCRHASEGCDRRLTEFAHYLVDVGQAHNLDPWLMAAMAFRESGMNPFAKGAVGELGILQINPGRRDARQVRFIRDGWYRQRCRKEAGACQREVVEHAARVLTRSLELCGGNMTAALGAYNSGHCGGGKRYAKRVLLEREELLRAAGVETDLRQAAAVHRRRAKRS